MCHNNNSRPLPQTPSPTLTLIIIIGLATLGETKPTGHVQQLPKVTLMRQDQGYYLPVVINHHSLKLSAQLSGGRSWLKEALCKVCDLGTDKCTSNCITDKSAAKISCDSSFCSRLGEFSDDTNTFSGTDTQLFLKIGEDSLLMPLVLADKLYQQKPNLGEFHLFDPQSSFSEGFLTRSPSTSLQLWNSNIKQDLSQLRQKEGDPLKVAVKGQEEEFDLSFLKVKRVVLHHVNDTKIADFVEESDVMDVSFSLQQPFLTFSVKLVKKLEKYLNQNYLSGKRCKLLPKRLKCSEDVKMQDLFRTFIHFQIEKQLLAIPFHLLVTGCSSSECSTLIHFEESPHATLTIGTVFWQLYNLEYSLKGRWAVFHRKNTQFDDLFLLDRVRLSEVSFMWGLVLIVYHTLRYILIGIFWLALLSLVVNLVVKWRAVVGWCRRVVFREKMQRVPETEQHFEGRSSRRINKLPDIFQDSQTLQ